jgi:hypothetical protein
VPAQDVLPPWPRCPSPAPRTHTLASRRIPGPGLPARRRTLSTPRHPAAAPPHRCKSWLPHALGGRSSSPPFDRMSTPETKPGFLSVGISALSPWGSRSGTPKPPGTPKTPTPAEEDRDEDKDKERERGGEKGKAAAEGAGPQRGGDHAVNRRHRLSLKRYPQDCPPLAVRWFHAVDVSS